MMTDELDLDFATELLSGTKSTTGGDERQNRPTALNRVRTQYPKRSTKYITWHVDSPSMKCASRGCSAPTHQKIESIPYCTIHAEFAIAQIIERLEIKIEVLERQLNKGE